MARIIQHYGFLQKRQNMTHNSFPGIITTVILIQLPTQVLLKKQTMERLTGRIIILQPDNNIPVMLNNAL